MNRNQSSPQPSGAGAIEQVFAQWQSGQIGESAALDRVCAAGFVGALTTDYLLEVSDATVRWGYREQWKAAIGLHRLIWACFEAGRARFDPVGATLAAHHLMISANGLWHQPDARVYREALAHGSSEYARATPSAARCELAQFLGILHLDPYVADRIDARQLKAWWQSADKRNSAAPDNGNGLPDALTALCRAEAWLRRALTDLPGEIRRLEILKALIQCLCGREIYGGALDEAAVRPLYREALPLVNAFPQRTDIATFLANVGTRLGEKLPGFDFSELLHEDWQTIRRRFGIGGVATRLTPALAYAARNEPAAGLALAEQVAWMFDEEEDEQERNLFYRRLIELLAGPPPGALPPAAGLDKLVADISAAEPGSAERQRKFGQGLGLTLGLAAENREAEAIPLLQRVCQAAEELTERHWRALSMHQAQLRVGEAVNQHEKSDADGTAVSYHLAWSAFVSIRFYHSALEIMERQADILPHATPATAQAVCELMREEAHPSGLPIEEKWQEACAKIASACTLSYEAGASADAWFALFRFAKGQTFANAILNPEAYDWTADPAAADLFKRWREIEGQVGEGCIDDDALFEEILTAYGSRRLETSGATLPEQRDNLAWAFDRRVAGQTGAWRDRSIPRFSLEEACAALPEDAVLLDLFRPRFRPGGNPFYCLALTRATRQLFGVTGMVDGFHGIEMTGLASEIALSVDSVSVSALRASLQAGETEPGHAADGALAERLHLCARGWLGHGLESLDALYAQGKRHLIVVPCGAIHFFPFHLLHVNGEPLAHRWTVTYLPNMDLLRRPAGAARDENACAIYGIDYHAPWARERGLDPLDHVAPEVAAVADACGAAPRLDEAVTPRTVREGLAASGIVHIACHGRHNAAAPSLQAIYLTPDADGDGRLFSADIPGMNLSGLSLLGLSACETALGRVDAGDNLRGMAAAALAAGASAVVGTLWPTRDDTNQFFFSRMYASLMNKETRREAFRQAQTETREQFPDFSDWGAFYLSGSW